MNIYENLSMLNPQEKLGVMNTQKWLSKNNYFPNYFSQIDKMSKVLNPLSSLAGIGIKEISKFPFTKAMEAIEKTTNLKIFLPHIPNYQSQISNLIDGFKPSKALLSAIDSTNNLFRSFNNSGIFDAISNITKNMSAVQAMTKVNALLPYVNPIDYDKSFTEDEKIFLNDLPFSQDDILEIAYEFENLTIENIKEKQNILKIKSKIGKIFLNILWLILLNLAIQPLINDTFDVFREYFGIDKILEKIDIKSWLTEKLYKNSVTVEPLDLEEDNIVIFGEPIDSQEP
jgi:hypothetical protein